MKATIYYFTGTGNSLKIARDLAAELDQAEVTAVADAVKSDEVRTDSETVGIVYPVYMFGEPPIISDFIRKLVVKRDTYVFCVVNYAGYAGGAFSQTERELKAQGIKLSAGFGIVMPGNYTPFYGAIPEEKQKKIFEKTAAKIKKIASIVRAKKDPPLERPSFLLDRVGDIFYGMLKSKIGGMDKEFWVSEGCTSCALCEKICPVDNITMTEAGRPNWMGHCQQCLACLQWCPKGTVQLGKMTPGRKRYHNPDVKLADMMPKK
jgi:ferredoxin